MWCYFQSTGVLEHDTEYAGRGYSGKGDGKNNGAMESVQCVGPIPRGLYSIGEPFDSDVHGPYAMHLSPDSTNEMYGRSGFLMHGDSLVSPGMASEGCVIMPRSVRNQVGLSTDKRLQVFE